MNLEGLVETPHTFAGNPLDRGDAVRRDEVWLQRAAQAPGSRFLPFHKLNALVRESASEQLELCWVAGEQVHLLGVSCTQVFLGTARDVAHFAVDVSPAADPLGTWKTDDALRFEDARMAAGALGSADAGVLAQGRAQLDWHRRHRYCGQCASETDMQRGGHVRVCPNCSSHQFPRTDPVAIMLIEDPAGDRCLLGQSAGRLARTGMYSALAGFVDQGESIEEAVRREVKEEAGVSVGTVRYHSSQPWPYPSSLMIGCHGRALSTDITIDPEEMADVAWFDRSTVRAALALAGQSAGPTDALRVPGAIAIAHHLIKAWVND